jgi:hypothetical protein
MRRKIKEIRKSKTNCDFNNWKGSDYARACLDWDDCKDCGAYTEKREDRLFDWLKIHGKCCSCEGTLKNSKFLNMVTLNKKAKWNFPTWGNVLIEGSGGRAVAIVCDKCIAKARRQGFHVKFAVEILSRIRRKRKPIYTDIKYHPLEELEDTFVITEEMIAEAERKLYNFGDEA